MDLNRESLSSSSQDNLTISTSIIPGASIEITSKKDLKANLGIMKGEFVASMHSSADEQISVFLLSTFLFMASKSISIPKI